MIYKTIVLITVFVALGLCQAEAQVVGGSASDPRCRQLDALANTYRAASAAFQAAMSRGAPPSEVCRLGNITSAARARALKALANQGVRCGIAADGPRRVRELQSVHVRLVGRIKKVCDAARRFRSAQ